MEGLFITMEGTDGSGKSLQAKMLFDYLTKEGYKVILTREPGGTPISEKIRTIILDNANKQMSPLTEAFLYVASRAQIIYEVIRPALLEGNIVICERYLDSSIVYQGIARGLGAETIDIINSYATGNLVPDITFLLDLDPSIALLRKTKAASLDRIERENREFHEKVYNGYKFLAEKHKNRIYTVDSSGPPEIASNIIINKTKSYLQRFQ